MPVPYPDPKRLLHVADVPWPQTQAREGQDDAIMEELSPLERYGYWCCVV
jgi:hypothetical protein